MNEIVKIDYKLNTASHNYDSFKGEQFAKSADGQVNFLFIMFFFILHGI